MNNKLYYKSVLAGLFVRDSCNSPPPAVCLLSFVHLKQDILPHRHHSVSCTVAQPQFLLLCNLADDFTPGFGSTGRGRSADSAETINTLWSYGVIDSASLQARAVICLPKMYSYFVYSHLFLLHQWIATATVGSSVCQVGGIQHF